MRNRPSQTAELVCLVRASDQRRPAEERILDDPLAAWFLSPLTRAALRVWEGSGRLAQWGEVLEPGLVTYILVRHRFIDDALRDALAAGAEQVVILGAGYDTRAFRFADALQGRPLFELDFPATQGRKSRRLEAHRAELPSTNLEQVPIDFEREGLAEALGRSGFRGGLRTFWVWEGVSMYLTRAAVKGTLDAIVALSGPGSSLAMDFWFLLDDGSLAATAHRMSPSFLHLLGEPMTFGLHPEDGPAFFARQGLELETLAGPEELRARYVRDQRRVYPACWVSTAKIP